MAIRTPAILPVVGENNVDGFQVVWSGLLNTDVGAAVGSTIGYTSGILAPGGGLVSGFADKSAACTGTPGAGAGLAIEGSNDGSNWFTLTDPFSNPALFTAAGIKALTEAVIQVRPHVTGGDGTTNWTVTMFFRRTNQ